MKPMPLDVLLSHPFVSPEQIAAILLWHPNAVRNALAELANAKLAASVNPRSPAFGARALYYPTQRAIAEYANATRRAECSGARILHLWLLIERLYRVRNLLLTLPISFHMQEWLVERALPFTRNKQTRQWHAHGLARVQNARGEFLLLVEWDTGTLAYDRTRMKQFADWYAAYLAKPSQERLPLYFLVLARDLTALLHYYAALRAASQARHIEMPAAYFAAQRAWFQYGSAAPIWYATTTGQQGNLLCDTAPSAHSGISLQKALSLSPLPVNRTLHTFDKLRPVGTTTSLSALAACKRDLSRQAKRLVVEIGAHPLLNASELAQIVQTAEWRVRGALAELLAQSLIEGIERDNERRFVLTTRGMAYLAAVQGFRHMPQRYVQARGWQRGFRSPVQFHAHTRLANQLLLQVAAQARLENARFEWRAEAESRLYFAAQGRTWSFLPDGLCFYRHGALNVQCAVEIERHRSSRQVLERKLRQYAVYVESALYRVSQSEEFRVWMVVTSWRHAERVRACLRSISRAPSSPPLPVYLTTSDLLQVRGAAQPIWRRADTWTRAHLLETWAASK